MGFVKDAVGSVIGGVGDVIGSTVGQIPGIGDVVQAGLPILGGAVGGPVGGALGGALSGAMAEDPSAGTVLGGAGLGLGAQQLLEQFRQQQEDASRARDLVNQGVGLSQQSADIALDQFQRNQPLRQAFRQGALGFSDPTNPFAQSAGAGVSIQPQQEQGPEPGSLQSRVDRLISNPRFSPSVSREMENSLGAIGNLSDKLAGRF